MIRKIVTVKEPKLREKSKPVGQIDKKVKVLVQDMIETLKAQKDPEGVGLAAPQVGVLQRIFLMQVGQTITPIINPVITKFSKDSNDPPENGEEEYLMEGCLSLPHYYGPVKRALAIELEYETFAGEKKRENFTGFPAQIIQHEVDHLNGKIFIDRLFEQHRLLYQLKKGHWKEVELP